MNNKVKKIFKSRKNKKRLIVLLAGGIFIAGLSFGAIMSAMCSNNSATTPQATAAPQLRHAATLQAKPIPQEEPKEEEHLLDPAEVELIGRTIWGEAGGVQSKAERAAVAWCILNRVDARYQSIEEVVTAPHQFLGYRQSGECPEEHLELAADVLARWYAEKDGAEDVGRVLPAEYLFFIGDGERNHFATEWKDTQYWNWSLPDPYITE